jgi:hypothetical protein
MCFVLYMASDRERPEIPWNIEARSFNVKADDADAANARGQFTKRNLYYLGSDNGCGCGYRLNPLWVDEKEPDKLREGAANQAALHRYVRSCLEEEDTIELFGCWSGDEALPAPVYREVTVNDLVDPEFYFAERERILVRR